MYCFWPIRDETGKTSLIGINLLFNSLICRKNLRPFRETPLQIRDCLFYFFLLTSKFHTIAHYLRKKFILREIYMKLCCFLYVVWFALPCIFKRKRSTHLFTSKPKRPSMSFLAFWKISWTFFRLIKSLKSQQVDLLYLFGSVFLPQVHKADEPGNPQRTRPFASSCFCGRSNCWSSNT